MQPLAMPAPLVSVIIPTYNRAALLHEALASVVLQSVAHWEAIVVDDGSTDDTAAMVAGFADDRIRMVNTPHSGNPARARNIGIREAAAGHVAFLDSDDLWQPDKLERQLTALRSAPDCRWSYSGYALTGAAGRPIPAHAGGPWRPVSGWILRAILLGEASVAIQTVLAERTLLMEVGLFDETILHREDFELTLRLAGSARALAVPETLTLIRDHPGRSTRTREDPHTWAALTYEKLVRSTADPTVRRLARRRQVEHLAAAATHWARSGEPGEGLRRLAAMLPRGMAAPSWWVALGKCMVHGAARRRGGRGAAS